ncbi:hypothetical protein F4818DRAFT_446656 [Hypoxylon cercidicola]|nr:hypothetical protein F4818DRAFT_446656 [Hypoxylon cercidicola]
MEISNPRRILAVSLTDSSQLLTRVIKDLTGSHPEQTSTSLAGSSHNLSFKNGYYKAEVPIWLDLISTPSEWADSFLSPEAEEVLEILGGVVVVFALPVQPQSDESKAARELIQNVGKVINDGLGGWTWDGVGLCLGVGEVDDVDEWEDCCADLGLEFIQIRNQSVTGRNEFGEKTGIARAFESLEANGWSQADVGDFGSDLEDFEAELGIRKDADEDGKGPELDPESLDFGFDREDFAGLRQAIWNAGQENEEDFLNGEPSKQTPGEEDGEELDDEIRKIERMMIKLQAVRDTSAGLPEDKRKQVAAKAVAEAKSDTPDDITQWFEMPSADREIGRSTMPFPLQNLASTSQPSEKASSHALLNQVNVTVENRTPQLHKTLNPSPTQDHDDTEDPEEAYDIQWSNMPNTAYQYRHDEANAFDNFDWGEFSINTTPQQHSVMRTESDHRVTARDVLFEHVLTNTIGTGTKEPGTSRSPGFTRGL